MRNVKEKSATTINEQKLVAIKDGKATTTSRKIAEAFSKRHDNVLRDIKELGCSEEYRLLNFEVTYKIVDTPNGGKRKDKEYVITKDGFVMLVMGYTGERAMKFKESYITAFNKMEEALLNNAIRFLPKDTSGITKGLSAIYYQQAKRYLYSELLRHMGLSCSSGAARMRIKTYPSMFVKLLGRQYVKEEFIAKIQLGKAIFFNNQLMLEL